VRYSGEVVYLDIYYILRFKRWRFCGSCLDIWRLICAAYLPIHIVKYQIYYRRIYISACNANLSTCCQESRRVCASLDEIYTCQIYMYTEGMNKRQPYSKNEHIHAVDRSANEYMYIYT
jgi:hypothetical protein